MTLAPAQVCPHCLVLEQVAVSVMNTRRARMFRHFIQATVYIAPREWIELIPTSYIVSAID